MRTTLMKEIWSMVTSKQLRRLTIFPITLIVFLVLVKGTLGPIVAVLMMVSGIRYLTSLAGAEVDVSALMRVV